MKHFLVQPKNEFIYLPSFRLVSGQRQIHYREVIGGDAIPVEVPKEPDRCSFELPKGAVARPDGLHLVIDELGTILTIQPEQFVSLNFRNSIQGIVQPPNEKLDDPEVMMLLRNAVNAVKS